MRFLRKAYNRLHDFIYDPSVDLKDRSFIVFSATVLIGLSLSVPIGLIIHEPLMATLSNIAGLLFFGALVVIAFKTRTIRLARNIISILLILIVLPFLFFTNGGVHGGMPIWLLLGTVYVSMILDGKFRIAMLVTHLLLMSACWTVGYYFPWTIKEYSREGIYFDTIAALFIVSVIIYALITFKNSLVTREEQQKNVKRLFEQTAMALVNAIDAKDKYTHGHSARVAEYSRKIAEAAGKSSSECDTIYYMALLHDVGKIGIPEYIINKEGKLTEEEYKVVQEHPELGAKILENISEFPYLAMGAYYHHERYDGKGYPTGLKGTDIPEAARIISVADAYDAMTSKRSYRATIPQQKVREEFVKGLGTQFDPDFGRIMIHLIDLDMEYEMKEHEELQGITGKNGFSVDAYKSDVSEGLVLSQYITTIKMQVGPDRTVPGRVPKPSLLVFDSLDAHFHDDEKEKKDLLYYEYCEIKFDGSAEKSGARELQSKIIPNTIPNGLSDDEFIVEAFRTEDHAFVRITGKNRTCEHIIAFPDCSRFAYLGFTGERCHFGQVSVVKGVDPEPEDAIPRIAPKISYLEGPDGDVPNIQINGYRTASTAGIEIQDGTVISFHAKGLPTSRLVWHCPFIGIFSSENGLVNGPSYRSFSLLRLDGECLEEDSESKVSILVNKTDDFESWNAWKSFVKDGFDCTVTFEKKDNTVTVRTVNDGIYIKSTTEILCRQDKLYATVTGDQCAITNIRIRK